MNNNDSNLNKSSFIELIINKIINKIIKKNTTLSIIIIYVLVTSVIAGIFYYLMPVLLNYPPNNVEVSRRLGTSYGLQYLIILFFAVGAGTLYFLYAFRGINNWQKLMENKEKNLEEIMRIRRKCINLPYVVFLGQILIGNIPLIPILFIVAVLNNIPLLNSSKIIIITFSFLSLAGVVSHLFSRKIFKFILLQTYIDGENEGIRISLGKKIFIQVLPMFIMATLIMGLIGYSRLIDEKGDMIYNFYKSQITERLENIKFTTVEDYFKNIQEIRIDDTAPVYFIKTPEKELTITNNFKLSGYLEYFIENPYKDDRIFDISLETQGVVKSIDGEGGIWKVGVIFKVVSVKTLVLLLASFFALLLLNIFVLYYFSKSLSGEISIVASSLTEIAEGEHVDLDRKISVTSNDEIGDLVIAFNKIQSKEKEYLKERDEQQAILLERERLASLGQLVGGIAHNMKTPIMSISGGLEALKDLISEYRDSVDDMNVTKEDHYEIAQEMLQWIGKIKPHCSYMSDIISAVKGQAVQFNNSSACSFTLDELIKKIEVLMKHELKMHHCLLNIDNEVPSNTELVGEINSLVQALNNVILNAIHSYDDREGNIDFIISRKQNNIEFIIRDYGKGISEDIRNKLFKEMITTKGKNGTGLGLYMSYSTIKGHFGGSMWFESEENKGTTFYVTIPKYNEAEKCPPPL